MVFAFSDPFRIIGDIIRDGYDYGVCRVEYTMSLDQVLVQ